MRLHAILNDHGDFVGEGRIVGEQRRNRAGENMAVAVLMLQAFAVERRAAGGCAQQKSFGFDIRRGPDQIADALEAEHRIVNIERESC